ncbi:MAG: hypothetical protein ABSE46_08870 [Terracidiphilus sp.]
MKRYNFPGRLLTVVLFTLLGFAVMGYHPGAEDDGVYLAAVKADLNPALFPHDADFFRLQLQATQFDRCMAGFVRVTRVPVAWAELTWHFICLFLILWACSRIARALFDDAGAELASMALLAAMFTLPVAGTALTLVDQYLHPRALATAFVLIAVERILAGRRWQAIPLLLLAFAVHPIMAAMGASFCFFLTLTTEELLRKWLDGENRIARWIRPQNKIKVGVTSALASAMPLSWVFDAPNPSWRRALDAKDYLHLSRWAWYEWLGALAPILLFWLLWRVAMRRGERVLARFSLAVFLYGVFQFSFALMLGSTPALIRFLPLQPMRFLHLVYFFLVLVGGGLLGRFVLRTSIWRWALFLLIINGAMFYAQRQLFSESPHIELPGRPADNPWLQAFDWIRQNTPTNAYFALGPDYMAAPGEDFHSFRALAERSQLADAHKDTAVAGQVPSLAPAWESQVAAQEGWQSFRLADFRRLKAEFGVDWVLVKYPETEGLACRWHNGTLAVCQAP